MSRGSDIEKKKGKRGKRIVPFLVLVIAQRSLASLPRPRPTQLRLVNGMKLREADSIATHTLASQASHTSLHPVVGQKMVRCRYGS